MRQVPQPTSYNQNLSLHHQLLLMVFSAEMANNMILILFMFVLVGSQRSLGLNLNHTQQLMMYGRAIFISHIGGIIANTGLGSLSDLIGRERLMRLACIALLTLAWLGSISLRLNSLYLFFLALLIYSTCFCLRPLALAQIGQIHDAQKKVRQMGYLQGSIALGATLGPLLSTHLNHLSHADIFLIASCFSLLALYLCPKNTTQNLTTDISYLSSIKPIITNWKILLSKPIMGIGLLLLTLDQLAWSSYYDFIPMTLKLSFHWPITQVGDFIAAIALSLIISCWLVLPQLQRKLSNHQIMCSSAVILLAGLLITATTIHWANHAIWGLIIGMLLTACGDVLFYSTLLSRLSDLSDKNHQGSLMGINYLIIALTWSATGLWGGWLSRFSTNAALLNAPVFGVTLCLILWINHKKMNNIKEK